MAEHARALSEVDGDAEAVRTAFGETSRPLVAVLAAAPSLSKGMYVFECPMASGYQKWIQTDSEISNPYMGSRMLTCGSASKP